VLPYFESTPVRGVFFGTAMTRSRALDVVLRLAFGGLLLTMTAVAGRPDRQEGVVAGR
jgi:hypothetical protein